MILSLNLSAKEMGVLFAMLYNLANAFGYLFYRKSLADLPASVWFLIEAIFGLLIWIPAAFILGIEFNTLPKVMIVALGSALLSEAFIFFIHTKGELSVTNVIFSSYALFTMLFSAIFLDERITSYQLLFIIIVLSGVLIVGLPAQFKKEELRKSSLIIWPILGAIAVGVSDTISKSVVEDFNPGTFLFSLAIMQLPIAITYLRAQQVKSAELVQIFNSWYQHQHGVVGALLIALSMLFFWLAFAYLPASIASPLTTASSVMIVPLAILFLNESKSIKKLLGLGLVLIGVFAVNFTI